MDDPTNVPEGDGAPAPNADPENLEAQTQYEPPTPQYDRIDMLIAQDDEEFAKLLVALAWPSQYGVSDGILTQPRVLERFDGLNSAWFMNCLLELAQPERCGIRIFYEDFVLQRMYRLSDQELFGTLLPNARMLKGFAASDIVNALNNWKKKLKSSTTSLSQSQRLQHLKGSGPVAAHDWECLLQYSRDRQLRENISNIALILQHHDAWKGRLWHDTVRKINMLDAQRVEDGTLTAIGRWLADELGMSYSHRNYVQQALDHVSGLTPRDLLQEWLLALPAWDGTPRLEHWLRACAGTEDSAYGRFVSHILPVSMVARAMEPGCQFRWVVILEGPEEFRKSSLVSALATMEWCIELSMALESKESHMLLCGAWVAELPELDSLSRTEDARLKAYITMRNDTFIPKYSNNQVTHARRTIFIGTTNEDTYLKSFTGNTRYLPITVAQVVQVEAFEQDRAQIFAEALAYYAAHLQDWWQMPIDAEKEAVGQREQRRIPSIYEDDLRVWLDWYIDPMDPVGTPSRRLEITWADIAEGFLHVDREAWKDSRLTREVTNGLKALGFVRAWTQATRGTKSTRCWRRK